VPALPKFPRELFDVRQNTAGVCVGIGANKSYAHRRRVAARAA
jgi:hypothetical protein